MKTIFSDFLNIFIFLKNVPDKNNPSVHFKDAKSDNTMQGLIYFILKNL